GEQGTDSRTTQGRNPPQSGELSQVFKLRLRQHPAITHQHDAVTAEAFAKRIDLGGHGRRIAGVTGEDSDGDRSTHGVGEQTVDEEGQALLAVSIVTVAGEGPGTAVADS